MNKDRISPSKFLSIFKPSVISLVLPISLLSLFLISCSSTYTMKDYPSKRKFYQDLNHSVKNKKVKITLLDNRSFYSNKGTEIINDSLYTIENVPIKNDYTIPAANIKKIDYLNTGYKEANILLKNGQELRAENISFLKDTISFINIRTLTVKKSFIQVDKIKSIKYKDHLLGVPIPFIFGTLSGFAAGALLGNFFNSFSNSKNTVGEILYIISSFTVIGAVVGIIWGWKDSYTYTYQFNP